MRKWFAITLCCCYFGYYSVLFVFPFVRFVRWNGQRDIRYLALCIVRNCTLFKNFFLTHIHAIVFSFQFHGFNVVSLIQVDICTLFISLASLCLHLFTLVTIHLVPLRKQYCASLFICHAKEKELFRANCNTKKKTNYPNRWGEFGREEKNEMDGHQEYSYLNSTTHRGDCLFFVHMQTPTFNSFHRIIKMNPMITIRSIHFRQVIFFFGIGKSTNIIFN